MDYKELLKDKSLSEFNDIADNWYARLNRLKVNYLDTGSVKCLSLIKAMQERLLIMSIMHMEIYKKMCRTAPNYPSGTPTK